MTGVARRPERGEVLDEVVIEVRQEPPGVGLRGVGKDARGRPIFAGQTVREGERAWRVYPRGEQTPLTERGRLLGGRFEEACDDADRVARENGFRFERPSELWLPEG